MPKKFELPAQKPGRHVRRSGIFGRALDELYEIAPDTGCWIWIGSFHATGTPLYRGWEYPRQFIHERQYGPLRPLQRLFGQYCGDTRCVKPSHQIVRPFIVTDPKAVDMAVMETLDRLVARGKMMLPAGGRFDHLITLLGLGYAYELDKEEHYTLVAPTREGIAIADWRAKRREKPDFLMPSGDSTMRKVVGREPSADAPSNEVEE